MSGSKRVRPLEQSLVHFSCVSPCAGRPALFFYGSNGRCSSSTYKSRYWFGGVQLTCLNLKNSHVLRLVEFKDPKHKHPPPKKPGRNFILRKKKTGGFTLSRPPVVRNRPRPARPRGRSRAARLVAQELQPHLREPFLRSTGPAPLGWPKGDPGLQT